MSPIYVWETFNKHKYNFKTCKLHIFSYLRIITILLNWNEVQNWRKILDYKWLYIHEEIEYKKIMSCSKVIELKMLVNICTEASGSGEMKWQKTVQGMEELWGEEI
jgi:hypothetical protein